LAAKKKRRVEQPALPSEERAAEAATVAWMLCALFTLCAEGVGLAARVVLARAGEQQQATPWSLLSDVTLVMALVTGTLCLLLTLVVYRVRKTPPPSPITVVAILVGLTPWARVVLGWLR
jgi:hypothetical protein